MKMTRSGVGPFTWALTALTIGIAPMASAQLAPIGLATRVEATGLTLGEDMRLHFFANSDLRYDTNPTLRPVGFTAADMLLRSRGGLRFERQSDRLAVTLGGWADWTQYFGVVDPTTKRLSTLQGQGDLSLLFNKDGDVSLFIDDQFRRADVPANISINARLRSWRNLAVAGTDLRLGARRTIELRLSYSNELVLYDPNQYDRTGDPTLVGLTPQQLTYMTHTPLVRAGWRFLDSATLFLEAQGVFTRYLSQSTPPTSSNMNGVRAYAGITAQPAEGLTLLAKAGYANTLLFGGPPSFSGDYSRPIGEFRLEYEPADTTRLMVGYVRDFYTAPLFGAAVVDRPYISVRQLFFSRLLVQLTGQYSHLLFDQGPREDHVLTAEIRIGVQMASFLAGSLYYMPDFRFSTWNPPGGLSATYQRHVSGFDLTFGY